LVTMITLKMRFGGKNALRCSPVNDVAAAATESVTYVADVDDASIKPYFIPLGVEVCFFTNHEVVIGHVAWKDLIQPSADLCRKGVPVSEYLDNVMKVKERHFRLFPSMKAWINPETNATYKVGDLLPRLKLADTLEKIANSEDPVKLFYHGEMADKIAAEMAEGGEQLSVRIIFFESGR
uniref:Tudor domain-containing protein n=1 Tax=Heligmosomoides polygyrus TaxID=6339 RepID=A0A183G4X1_HELPZ